MLKKKFSDLANDPLFIPYILHNGNIFWNEPYRFPDQEQSYRPKCINHNCYNPVAVLRGTIGEFKGREIRTVCGQCHEASYGKKPLKPNVKAHKKDHCENRDGHLGFACTSTIHSSANLELDHIDGNHFNNIPGNVQTLCQICHTQKSIINGDFKRSPQQQRSMGLPPPSIALPVACLSPSTKSLPSSQSTSPCIVENDPQQSLDFVEIQPTAPSDLS